jgi:hypothetical protein
MMKLMGRGSARFIQWEEVMTISKSNRTALWVAILTLIFAIATPTVSLAQGRGRGRGQDKKAGKFKNGHDARDGRWDGRGPGGRDDRDDDDDYYRDRNNGRTNNRSDITRQALSIGYREGYSAGRDDRSSGRSFDYNDHNTYRDATIGYSSSYGDIDTYRRSFREGFRQGYEDGYRNRTSGSGRWGGILGDILGRP